MYDSLHVAREKLTEPIMPCGVSSALLFSLLQEAMSAEAAAKFKMFEVRGCYGDIPTGVECYILGAQ